MGDHISPWMPEQDRIRLAVLGKLVEECNELGARAARCIIQGIDEIDPDSGRTNRAEMAREVADVLACIDALETTEGVDADELRVLGKVSGFRRWHEMIEAAEQQAQNIGEVA